MRQRIIVLFGILILATRWAVADTAILSGTAVTQDAIIFAENPTFNAGGATSSRIGRAGNATQLRRFPILFDVSSIPTNATVSAVSLQMRLTNAGGGPANTTVKLHRLTASWVEGTITGTGGALEAGSVSWNSRQQGTLAWTAAGGDYNASASAQTVVGNVLSVDYTWSGGGMITDAQGWVDGSIVNNGWIFIGDETVNQTVRGFASSEETVAPTPTLTITYTTPQPEIDATPTSHDFGDRDVDDGASTGQAITITNNGPGTLNFTSVALFGGDSGEFTITNDTLEPALANGASRIVTVAFNPTSTGSKSTNLRIVSDDSDEATVDISFSGEGIDQEIDVSPTDIPFGDQDLDDGATSAVTVTISNDGSADLNIASVSLVSGDTGEFALIDSGEPLLAPTETRTVQVTFNPTSTGAKAATLRILSDDTDEGTVDVSVSGTGVDQEVQVSPTSSPFGDQDVDAGDTSAVTVTITNGGTADLNLASVGLVSGDIGEFALVDSGEPVLAPAEFRTVEVTFNPSSVGAKGATLRIISDDTDEPTVDVPLSGTGIDQELLVTGGPLDFSTIDIDDGTTGPLILTVTNSGTATLHFIGGTPFEITGTEAADFTFTAPPDASPLAPSQSRQISLVFDPSATGDRNATLVITSDGGTANIGILGVGTDQEIGVTPPALNFVARVIGGPPSAALAVTVANSGNGPLSFTGTGIEIEGPQAGEFEFETAPSTAPIPAFGSRQIMVVFHPLVAVGTCNATLKITTNDSDEPTVTVPLTGEASASPLAAGAEWSMYE